MDKNELPKGQKVTDVSTIETDPIKLRTEAQDWADDLCRRARVAFGVKADHAREMAARWAGLTPNTLWKLKYRPPAEVGASVYNRLKLAHARYVKSPEATIAENLAAFRSLPSTPARARLLAGMEEYLRASEGEENGSPAEPTRTQSSGE